MGGGVMVTGVRGLNEEEGTFFTDGWGAGVG